MSRFARKATLPVCWLRFFGDGLKGRSSLLTLGEAAQGGSPPRVECDSRSPRRLVGAHGMKDRLSECPQKAGPLSRLNRRRQPGSLDVVVRSRGMIPRQPPTLNDQGRKRS
jgi:hypothetical protein